MKQNLKFIIVGLLAAFAVSTASAATVINTNSTDTIGTFRTNVNTSINNLNTAIVSTSTPLGTIASLSTTTGNIIVGSTANGWSVLAVGANGYCPQASSTATLGIAWAICGGSINGTISQSYVINASGTGLSIVQNGATTTVTLDPTKYLQPSNNLSELTNTSTARTNIGYQGSSNISIAGNGTISFTGVLPIANGGTATATAPTDAQFLGANGAVPTWKSFVAGSNITISTSTTSTTINSSASTAVGGSDTQVEYNNNGALGATSTITVNSSTPSISVGKSASFTTAFNSNTTATATIIVNYTGATTTFVVPHGVTKVRFIVDGAGGQTGVVSAGGPGGEASGTITTSEGTIFTLCVGGKGSGGTGGLCGGGSTTGGTGGGGMSWVSTSTSFSTTTVVIVGAGGGGGRSSGTNLAGGGGGGIVGAAGGGAGGQDGKGGSQTAGGAAGGDGSATAGSAGVGGNGGTVNANKGAGGGGGYFGGGGGSSVVGGDSGAGGGGSSFTSAVMTATSTATSTGAPTDTNGTITIQYLGTPSYSFAVQDHILTGNIASSTVAACGTSPSNVGNDTTGAITTGSGSPTSCTYNFAHNWANAPVCTANDNTTSTYVAILTVSTSSVKFGFSSALSAGVVYYTCLGY